MAVSAASREASRAFLPLPLLREDSRDKDKEDFFNAASASLPPTIKKDPKEPATSKEVNKAASREDSRDPRLLDSTYKVKDNLPPMAAPRISRAAKADNRGLSNLLPLHRVFPKK